MSDFLRDYLTVVWFGAIALLLAGLLLGISALVRPNKPSVEKLTAYESGVDPVGDGWSQSQVRYYIFALLFVVFDVEAVFIFPWATQLELSGRWFVVGGPSGDFAFVRHGPSMPASASRSNRVARSTASAGRSPKQSGRSRRRGAAPSAPPTRPAQQ